MKLNFPLAILAFGSGAMGFVIEAYSQTHCMGESQQQINIHDNTCRDSDIPDMTRSIKLVAYGAWKQRASLYYDDWCNLDDPIKEFWVDGGSVKEGECVSVNAVIRSFASWSR